MFIFGINQPGFLPSTVMEFESLRDAWSAMLEEINSAAGFAEDIGSDSLPYIEALSDLALIDPQEIDFVISGECFFIAEEAA